MTHNPTFSDRTNTELEGFQTQVKRFWEIGLFTKEITYIFDCPKREVNSAVKDLHEKDKLGKDKPTKAEAYPLIFSEYLKVRDKYFSYSTGLKKARYPDSFGGEKRRFYKVLENRLGFHQVLNGIAAALLGVRRKMMPEDGRFSNNLCYFRLLDSILDLGWSVGIKRKIPSIANLERNAKDIWDQTCLSCWENDERVRSQEGLLTCCLDQIPRPKAFVYTWNKEVCEKMKEILRRHLWDRELRILQLYYRFDESREFKSFNEVFSGDFTRKTRSYDKIGTIFSLSKSRVGQIVKQAEEKVRESELKKELKFIFEPSNL